MCAISRCYFDVHLRIYPCVKQHKRIKPYFIQNLNLQHFTLSSTPVHYKYISNSAGFNEICYDLYFYLTFIDKYIQCNDTHSNHSHQIVNYWLLIVLTQSIFCKVSLVFFSELIIISQDFSERLCLSLITFKEPFSILLNQNSCGNHRLNVAACTQQGIEMIVDIREMPRTFEYHQ